MTQLQPNWLFPVSALRTSKVIRVPLDKAKAALHPAGLIQLSNLVRHFHELPERPGTWHIVDQIHFFGLLLNVPFLAEFSTTDNGIQSVVTTGFGTRLVNTWTAKELSPDQTEISETIQAQAFRGTESLVLRNLKQSRGVIFGRLARNLEDPQVSQQSLAVSISKDRTRDEWKLPVLAAVAVALLALRAFHRLTWLGIIGLAVLPLITLACYRRSRDPYGLFHWDLNNSIDDGCVKKEPTTEWLNMGFWDQTTEFPAACEALARAVLQHARCKPGGIVLDVGCGCGDSLLLQLREKGFRPQKLVGVTSLGSQFERAIARVQAAKFDTSDGILPKVHLHHGDAIYREFGRPSEHPLSAKSKDTYSSVLALDCAYHFNTRALFFKQVLYALQPGGTMALTDVVLPDGIRQLSIRGRLASSAFSVPSDNLWSKARYIYELQSAGFVDCVIEDITDSVFPGFRSYLQRRGGVWNFFERWGVGVLADSGMRYVVVSAVKPKSE